MCEARRNFTIVTNLGVCANERDQAHEGKEKQGVDELHFSRGCVVWGFRVNRTIADRLGRR
jgi:hypothetical protein